MEYPLVILGGGLSGLAAGIRFARFGQKVLILEKHTIPGGLNSYYTRHGRLLETGLHAMTNYAPANVKSAPLSRLFRQLKLKRKNFVTRSQVGSQIIFPDKSLSFTNTPSLLLDNIAQKFPDEIKGFQALLAEVETFDAFDFHQPRISAKKKLSSFIKNETLLDMLLCPLMLYGNSEESDMDYAQFVIMFRSVYLEGFFRPGETIKEFLEMLVDHLQDLGGEIRYNAEVENILAKDKKVQAVRLTNGEDIGCANILSTIGAPATMDLLPDCLSYEKTELTGRMSFVESIYLLSQGVELNESAKNTIIFYNKEEKYNYRRPDSAINSKTGVICFPSNFHGMPKEEYLQVRVTHPANYDVWAKADIGPKPKKGRTSAYLDLKKQVQEKTVDEISEIIGNFSEKIVYTDTFTPLTIEKFTKKAQGAIYGSPIKIKTGKTNYKNLFLAGTDQGFLGIVGSMLSGITIVNQCILLDS